MAEYIDKQALIDHLKEDPLFPFVERYGVDHVIDSFPSVDVLPAVHGEWEFDSDKLPICTNCNNMALQKVLLRFPHQEYYSKFILSPYCPYCGAQMKIVPFNDSSWLDEPYKEANDGVD